MATATTYPLLFHPVYKDYIWGGNRISREFNRNTRLPTCAESWEVSDRPEGMSLVANGEHAGTSLHELVTRMGTDLVGVANDVTRFPLLIKILDAKKRLSVQVHPNNKNAQSLQAEPKTEMWYVLDAEPDAIVYAGLTPGTTRESFEQAMAEGTLVSMLNAITVKQGDVVFIPGGTIHAIAEGCLLLEVQQNSNTTYRVYDWDRVGADGKPRELHVEKALAAINWDETTRPNTDPIIIQKAESNTLWELVACPYFRIMRHDLSAPELVTNDGQSFHALFVESGQVRVSIGDCSETLPAGTSCLIPASVGEYELVPVKDARVVRIGTV